MYFVTLEEVEMPTEWTQRIKEVQAAYLEVVAEQMSEDGMGVQQEVKEIKVEISNEQRKNANLYMLYVMNQMLQKQLTTDFKMQLESKHTDYFRYLLANEIFEEALPL